MCYWCKCELVTQLIFIGFQWQRLSKTQYFLHIRLKRLQSHIHKILFINNLPTIPKMCPNFHFFFVLLNFLWINCSIFNNWTIALTLWNHLGGPLFTKGFQQHQKCGGGHCKVSFSNSSSWSTKILNIN